MRPVLSIDFYQFIDKTDNFYLIHSVGLLIYIDLSIERVISHVLLLIAFVGLILFFLHSPKSM